MRQYLKIHTLHKSQMTVEVDQDGNAIFLIEVILNYELEKDLLGFGESIRVLSPKSLRDTIARPSKPPPRTTTSQYIRTESAPTLRQN